MKIFYGFCPVFTYFSLLCISICCYVCANYFATVIVAGYFLVTLIPPPILTIDLEAVGDLLIFFAVKRLES